MQYYGRSESTMKTPTWSYVKEQKMIMEKKDEYIFVYKKENIDKEILKPESTKNNGK